MKLISIDQACGHTAVIVEKNNIEYFVSIANYGDGNEVYENSNFRKIRKDSRLHEMFCSFAQSKIAQQAAA
jgi:hypothetical protein